MHATQMQAERKCRANNGHVAGRPAATCVRPSQKMRFRSGGFVSSVVDPVDRATQKDTEILHEWACEWGAISGNHR